MTAHNEVLEPGPITPQVVNGYRSFFVPPDGSKEGWDHSCAQDERRAAFLAWVRAEVARPDVLFSVEWIAVHFGELGRGIDDCSAEEEEAEAVAKKPAIPTQAEKIRAILVYAKNTVKNLPPSSTEYSRLAGELSGLLDASANPHYPPADGSVHRELWERGSAVLRQLRAIEDAYARLGATTEPD